MALRAGWVCDAGDRRTDNQDSVLANIRQIHESQGFFLVADGMGGAACGREASQAAAEVMADWWKNTHTFRDAESGIDAALDLAQEKVLGISREARKMAGTTLSLLLIMGGRYLIRHVGDSRIYRLDPEGLVQITPDHSYVAEQVRAGRMLPEEAKTHPKRNMLTQCIGMRKNPVAFKQQGETMRETTFLLCSDGFFNAASETAAIAPILSTANATQEKAYALRGLIEEGQADDNVSLIVVCVEKAG